MANVRININNTLFKMQLLISYYHMTFFHHFNPNSYSLIFLALLKKSRLKVNFQDTPVNLIKCFPFMSQIEKERKGVIYE